MKKKPSRAAKSGEMRPEYDQSKLRGGVRGKHFAAYKSGTNLALLAPDVRAAFPTDEAVDKALRAMMNRKPA